MLSLSQFRTHLFPLFSIMRGTGETFEVVRKGIVYDIEVRKTDKVPQLTRAKRQSSHEIVAIDTDECPLCNSLRFNGICMNTKCVSV